jgi:DNA-binding MarR family transcriptional regulator
VFDNLAMAHPRARPDLAPAVNLFEADLKSVIGYQLAQAGVVTSRVYDIAVGEATGLHRVEYSILMLVGANPGCTASSLAKALDVSSPNITLWLERVTGKGLVERTPSAADRRSIQLRLTAAGEQTARQATQAILKAEEATLTSLSVGERVILAELLHKVAACRSAIGAD